MTFCLPILLGFFLLGFYCLRGCRARIASGTDGIWYLMPHKPPLFLHWEEVYRAKEHVFAQALVLADRGSNRKIRLDYHLENFDELLAEVVKKTRNRENAFPLRTLFNTSRSTYTFFLSLALLCAWLAYLFFVHDEFGFAWFFIALGVFLAGGLFTVPWEIRIGSNELVLKSWLRRRSVPFAEIGNVKLQTISAPKGGRVLTLFIERCDGKRIQLGAVRGGSIALYESLHYHWRNSQEFRHAKTT